MYAETVLTPADLIWPLFIVDGQGVEEPIPSLPGVSRWSVDGIVARAKEARDLGVACIALFPNREERDAGTFERLTPSNQTEHDGGGGGDGGVTTWRRASLIIFNLASGKSLHRALPYWGLELKPRSRGRRR